LKIYLKKSLVENMVQIEHSTESSVKDLVNQSSYL